MVKRFFDQPIKAITLVGMSGVGKTHFAAKLERWGWRNHSCDYFIGAEKLKLEVTPQDLSALSAFIGKLGDPKKGGLPLAEFKARQKLYYDAECDSLDAACDLAEDAAQNFVNDASGSLCEIEDEALIARLAERTLFVYIEASEQENARILERARNYPKPLFFPPSRFDAWLAEYMKEKSLVSSDKVEPEDFARWVFPRLFESRLPKYQRLAELYGVTISSKDLHAGESEDGFMGLLRDVL